MIISHTLILLSPFHLKTPLQNLHTQFRPKPTISLPSIFNPWKLKTYKIQSKAAVRSDGEAFNWKKWLPRKVDFGPDKVLQSIAGATSSPICQFITSPTTFLHIVDPRIKLRAPIFTCALGLCFLLLFCPLGYSQQTCGSVSQRTPPPSFSGLSNIPSSFKGYKYMLFKFGPLQMTRKGLSIASTSACLTFTILQSASLCLSTTPPEQLASALRWFLLPLARIGVPVAEIVLTLMLSLRFINLIFDEVKNVALGILSRRIDWQDMTLLEKVDVFVMYIRRIFKNIFSHAEQISQAMIVRGFRGDSNRHKIHFQPSSFTMPNLISLLALCGVIGATRLSGSLLV
ncbi:protein ABCI12, chloroplastic isoform X2 [Spinacia oleracea]|uniref:Protein ABCI12, chloroplastic isoform X2 n=1 Tax=Spinacia oleracea TaxID=3562 RepID=A0ABM3RVK5_SPIOL|nr:protein ABCI12, chloroplastic isoform X2 [Spinacia oleracea]